LNEIDEVSISLLQRRFRIGYNRSARIIDMLESQGLIMPADGGKTRRVIR
jgi:S-DNA-T family DNA segregation ATPase FtsK/SpoIIIE